MPQERLHDIEMPVKRRNMQARVSGSVAPEFCIDHSCQFLTFWALKGS